MSQNKSRVRTIAIKYLKNSGIRIIVTPQGIEVRFPEGFDESKAMEIVNKHKMWIERRMQELSELIEISKQLEIIDRNIEELRQMIKTLADQAMMEVLGISNPCKIIMKKMTRKWASLSSKGVLTINKQARFLPDPLIKYIVYHEICHFLERKHNNRFWSCVERFIPNYEELEKTLWAYEFKLAETLGRD
ncbi:MAG: YgjP-like metallopeptidase domain-containing protein [Desulfurococcus sp.]|uniref:YgjP-like metallopeptidase domain-containing protein n=1 Tax=Desulfurococcus sp. TaxID=51678 RepID=UPI00317D96E8